MARVHKFEAYEELHSLVDSCDFKAKLEEFFGSEIGYYHRKEVNGISFYFNSGTDNWDNKYMRFSAVKRYNFNEILTYDVYLDANFKSRNLAIGDDWSGYCFEDLLNGIKQAVKF